MCASTRAGSVTEEQIAEMGLTKPNAISEDLIPNSNASIGNASIKGSSATVITWMLAPSQVQCSGIEEDPKIQQPGQRNKSKDGIEAKYDLECIVNGVGQTDWCILGKQETIV